jgi:hypothetical protein
VPSADDVAALAEQRLVERLESKMKADNEEVIDDSQSIEEFPLGDFSIPVKPSGTEDKYNLDFTLFGTVKKKDISTLEKLFKAREGRFRNRLQLEIRNASIDELTEAQLGLIQRRILATTNEILEDPLIVGVGFKQYQLFME